MGCFVFVTLTLAEIHVGETHVSDVVQEQRRPAPVNERTNRFALFGLHPELRLRAGLRRGRVEGERRAASGDPRRVGGLIRITIGPHHTVTKDDEEPVARERLGVQHPGFVAEVDGDAHLLLYRASEPDPNVIGVVIAVADEAERCGFLRRAGQRRGENCASQCGKGRPSTDRHGRRL